MLSTITKNITLSATSVITVDGKDVIAQRYTATLNTTNPDDMNLSEVKTNKSVYKANRAQCRADQAEFEETAYALQDEMLAETQTDDEEEEDTTNE